MNELVVKDNINIEDMIYEVRGKQLMLDSDLAKLYECKNGTKEINQAVKNNLDKFPERFSWKLTDDEAQDFLVKNFDQKIETRGGRYKNPRVFTEQGVAMLATVLKSKVATQTSISIMDAFVSMKKYISSNLLEQKYINNMVFKLDERLTLLESTFSNFKTFSNEIFFEGQIYDAHSLLLDIFNTSNKTITIIDNYISKELLDVLSKTTKKIIVYTKNIDKNLIDKYQAQYNNLSIKINNSFHDRFIIIDNKYLYHCGASFKDLGKKCFAINKVENSSILKELLKNL